MVRVKLFVAAAIILSGLMFKENDNKSKNWHKRVRKNCKKLF